MGKQNVVYQKVMLVFDSNFLCLRFRQGPIGICILVNDEVGNVFSTVKKGCMLNDR